LAEPSVTRVPVEITEPRHDIAVPFALAKPGHTSCCEVVLPGGTIKLSGAVTPVLLRILFDELRGNADDRLSRRKQNRAGRRNDRHGMWFSLLQSVGLLYEPLSGLLKPATKWRELKVSHQTEGVIPQRVAGDIRYRLSLCSSLVPVNNRCAIWSIGWTKITRRRWWGAYSEHGSAGIKKRPEC